MKTFKEFCEQTYNPFSKTPKAQPNVVQQFMNRIGDSVRSAQETGEMAAAALDPKSSPLQKHLARTDLLFKLRGGNYKNPDNMPTQGPKDNKSYSLRHYFYKPSFRLRPTAHTFFRTGKVI